MTLAYRAPRHADDSGQLVVRSHRALQAAEESLRAQVDATLTILGRMVERTRARSAIDASTVFVARPGVWRG